MCLPAVLCLMMRACLCVCVCVCVSQPRLDEDSAYAARGCSAAVAFVNDDCSRPVSAYIHTQTNIDDPYVFTRKISSCRVAPPTFVFCCCACTWFALFVSLCTQVLEVLKDCGVKILAMRCTGYDKVDLKVRTIRAT